MHVSRLGRIRSDKWEVSVGSAGGWGAGHGVCVETRRSRNDDVPVSSFRRPHPNQESSHMITEIDTNQSCQAK